MELYQFMSEHNVCNSLGIDVQKAYEIYKASNDFLLGKHERKVDYKLETIEKLEA